MNTLFPIFLKTEHLRFLIVGGGRIGLEKTETLLRQSPEARIKLIGTVVSPELKTVLASAPNASFFERPFEEADLENIDLAIIATDDSLLNAGIKQTANLKGILVNAADQPALCDFYLGSIVNKGDLKIAISTNGKAPVLARRMREHLQDAIPENINEGIEQLDAFRKTHKGDLQAKLKVLNKATEGLAGSRLEAAEGKKYRRLSLQLSLLFLALFVGYGAATVVSVADLQGFAVKIPNVFYAMIMIGFFAQLVDGAFGLGYGVTCATSLMLLGIGLPSISGSIHTAEMFASAANGYSHYKFGNVNKKLLAWLATAGVLGAVSGALTLSFLGENYQNVAYGLMAFYTMSIGIRLAHLAFRTKTERKKIKFVGPLGFVGGFLDAFSGGGWGPVVTSTLLSKGRQVRYVVGTVSLAEFFVTLSSSIVFFAILGVTHWYIALGLILGGLIAAPVAARLAGKIPRKAGLLAVSALVIIFSLRAMAKIL